MMNYKKAISGKLSGKSPNHAATIALALIGGIAAGAIISLLFAPQSGEETRGMIADKTKGLADGVKDKFRSIRSHFRSEAEEMVNKSTNGHTA